MVMVGAANPWEGVTNREADTRRMDTNRETDLGVLANVILFGVVTALEWL